MPSSYLYTEEGYLFHDYLACDYSSLGYYDVNASYVSISSFVSNSMSVHDISNIATSSPVLFQADCIFSYDPYSSVTSLGYITPTSESITPTYDENAHFVGAWGIFLLAMIFFGLVFNTFITRKK